MESNIQNTILDALKKERKVAVVFTVNGYQMKGRVTAYDQYTIVLQEADKQMIVYKSAISTIVPEAPISL